MRMRTGLHGALWRARPPHSGWIMGKLNAERFAKLSEDCRNPGHQCSALSENREEVHRAHQADSGNPAGVCGEDGGSRPGKSSGYRVQRIAVHYTLIGEIDLLPEYSKYEKKQPHDALASCGCLPPGKLLYQCSSDGAALVFGQAFHRLRQPRGSLGPLPVLRQGVRFPGTPIPPSGA